MDKIKHVAIATKDADRSARFFTEVFDVQELFKVDHANASGYYLSDGNVSLAILDYKTDYGAGADRGTNWVGIHHMGFQVENLAETVKRLEAVKATPRGEKRLAGGGSDIELKYNAPDGVILDVSQKGWKGTSDLNKPLPRIKHVAVATKDADQTAQFYINAFGLKEVGKVDNEHAKAYFLSDGTINFAVLHYLNHKLLGSERPQDWVGIHHMGFHVNSMDKAAEKLAAAGYRPRDDINSVLGNRMAGPGRHNAEVKYGGPGGVLIDVSQSGWLGT